MRTPLGTSIIVSVMILLDFYVFSALQAVTASSSEKIRTLIFSLYWIVAILAIAGLVLFVFTDATFMSKKVRTYLFATILAFVFAQIVSTVFFLMSQFRKNFIRLDARAKQRWL